MMSIYINRKLKIGGNFGGTGTSSIMLKTNEYQGSLFRKGYPGIFSSCDKRPFLALYQITGNKGASGQKSGAGGLSDGVLAEIPRTLEAVLS